MERVCEVKSQIQQIYVWNIEFHSEYRTNISELRIAMKFIDHVNCRRE